MEQKRSSEFLKPLHNAGEKVLVTGGAGFIGSHIVDELVQHDCKIQIVDNLSSGRLEAISNKLSSAVTFSKVDLKDKRALNHLTRDVYLVYHFAANPDVRDSVMNPDIHFQENVVTTFNLLESLRQNDFHERFIFASTSAVYGDVKKLHVSEKHPVLKPLSVYGATKLMCESLILTYSSLYDFRAVNLRFGNVIGLRSRHGVIFDFINKLKKKPEILEILGDGQQTRSYIHIADAITAIMTATKALEKQQTAIFNVGSDDFITVLNVAEFVLSEMGIENRRFVFRPATKDGRGWLGDMKNMSLDCTRLKKYGWQPRMNSCEAVRATTSGLIHEMEV